MTKMVKIGDVEGLLDMGSPPCDSSSMWDAVDMGVGEAVELFNADDMEGYRTNRDILDKVLDQWDMAVNWTYHLRQGGSASDRLSLKTFVN